MFTYLFGRWSTGYRTQGLRLLVQCSTLCTRTLPQITSITKAKVNSSLNAAHHTRPKTLQGPCKPVITLSVLLQTHFSLLTIISLFSTSLLVMFINKTFNPTAGSVHTIHWKDNSLFLTYCWVLTTVWRQTWDSKRLAFPIPISKSKII